MVGEHDWNVELSQKMINDLDQPYIAVQEAIFFENKRLCERIEIVYRQFQKHIGNAKERRYVSED